MPRNARTDRDRCSKPFISAAASIFQRRVSLCVQVGSSIACSCTKALLVRLPFVVICGHVQSLRAFRWLWGTCLLPGQLGSMLKPRFRQTLSSDILEPTAPRAAQLLPRVAKSQISRSRARVPPSHISTTNDLLSVHGTLCNAPLTGGLPSERLAVSCHERTLSQDQAGSCLRAMAGGSGQPRRVYLASCLVSVIEALGPLWISFCLPRGRPKQRQDKARGHQEYA